MQLLLMGKHHMISIRVSLMWGCWLNPCCRVKHVSRGMAGGIKGLPLGSSVYILLHCRADSNSRSVFNRAQAPVLIPSRTLLKNNPCRGAWGCAQNISHTSTRCILNAASHPLLAFELLASVMSPSDPNVLPSPVLIQRVLSLLAFGVKHEQQLPVLCGEWLLGQLGRIPWRQH